MKRNDIEYTADAEIYAIEECAQYARGDTISDRMVEKADSLVDVYDAQVIKWAADNPEWVDEAMAAGLVDTRNLGGNAMTAIAQAAQFEYYFHMLYENKAAIALNYAFDYMDADEIPDELAEQIIDAADGLDKFAEIEQIIDDYKADHE